jgi:hypothetical protein
MITLRLKMITLRLNEFGPEAVGREVVGREVVGPAVRAIGMRRSFPTVARAARW